MNPMTPSVPTVTSPRIPQSKLKKYREEQLKLNPICQICNQSISTEEAVGDHDHRTGHHRSILHRSCNSLLGKIENNYRRYGVSGEQLALIAPSVWEYINRDWSQNPFHWSWKPKPIRKPRKAKVK